MINSNGRDGARSRSHGSRGRSSLHAHLRNSHPRNSHPTGEETQERAPAQPPAGGDKLVVGTRWHSQNNSLRDKLHSLQVRWQPWPAAEGVSKDEWREQFSWNKVLGWGVFVGRAVCLHIHDHNRKIMIVFAWPENCLRLGNSPSLVAELDLIHA